MNERIKELAIQSQLVFDSDGKLLTGWMEHVDLTEYVTKFAELLVQECIDIMNATATAKKAAYMGDDVPTVVHQIKIEKHFGVK